MVAIFVDKAEEVRDNPLMKRWFYLVVLASLCLGLGCAHSSGPNATVSQYGLGASSEVELRADLGEPLASEQLEDGTRKLTFETRIYEKQPEQFRVEGIYAWYPATRVGYPGEQEWELRERLLVAIVDQNGDVRSTEILR